MRRRCFWVSVLLAVMVLALGAVPAVAQSVCPLEVDVSAQPALTRTFTWTIDKVCEPGELWLSLGETGTVHYTVALAATSVDGGFHVRGLITLTNPGASPVTITGVSAVVAPSIPATVDCSVSFPYDLPAGETLACTYAADLPCTMTRNVNVTVVTSQGDCTGQGVSDFAYADLEEVDECVDVLDSLAGDLGTVWADEAPKTLAYDLPVGPFTEAGDVFIENAAAFLTNDTSATGSDECAVCAHVCEEEAGCTRTPGYWKTHSERGPASYDDTWAELPEGAATDFFLSGKSYYQVLWTPKRGNVYYILAFQYIAAELNMLSGASAPDDVLAAFDEATELFDTYTPAQLAKQHGKGKKAKRDQNLREHFLCLAEVLRAYNSGELGPGHCPD